LLFFLSLHSIFSTPIYFVGFEKVEILAADSPSMVRGGGRLEPLTVPAEEP
jgi:hypothetical protein